MRRLARGEDAELRAWIASESAWRLAEARAVAREGGAAIVAAGARLITLADAEYPAGLHDLTDPPPFLIVRGRLPPRGIAVIGSREAAPQAIAATEAIVSAMAAPLVSGLARGIDAAAHQAALARRLPQVAYVATGLGETYPPEHRELAEAIVATGGAIASEYVPGTAVSRWRLVRRDRLQAAHSSGVVLVTSEPDGGAMQTMRFAERLGRRRFALAPESGFVGAGNAVAIANGAKAVTVETVPSALAQL